MKVLECNERAPIPNYPDPTPPTEGDPAKVFLEQVATFKSMTSLCGQYPAGMGYYCPPAGGALLVQTPASQLYDFLGPPDSQYLKDACLANCYCTQIAPGDPDPSSSKPASAQCLADVGESDSDDEVDVGGCMDTYHDPEADDGIECDASGYLYGHPVDADCELAQDGIGEGFEMQDSYEFLAVGAQSVYSGYDIAQTPYNWTVGRCCCSSFSSSQLISIGTCYIQVSMLDRYALSNIENWDYIWGRADAIRQKCVAGLGVGGFAKAGKITNASFQTPKHIPLINPRRRILRTEHTPKHRHLRLRHHFQNQTNARHEILLHHRCRRQLLLRLRLRLSPRVQKAENLTAILPRQRRCRCASDCKQAQQRRAIWILRFLQRLRLQKRLHLRRD